MERGRQHSPRRQPQQPEHRRRAGKPEAHEGKNKYSKEALKQDITDIETQAQLLERAGEAAEKKRDFEAAEKHFLEAARLMGEAQALKRRTFKASQSRNKNYARHMGQQQGRGARAQHHSSVVIGATMRHYAQDTESYRTAAGDDDDDDVGDDGASMAQQDPDGYDDDGEPIPPQPIEDEVEVLDKKLNRTLGKTLLSHRDMHTRSEIVAADQRLLDALGWSKGKRERLLDAFRAITSSPHMTFHHFAAFLSTQGVSLKFAVPLFRAFDRRQHGTWLSDGDFVVGVGACARNTPHSGGWLRVRLGFIFRFFSTNGKTMTQDQLEAFLAEACAADPSIKLRLPEHTARSQQLQHRNRHRTYAFGDDTVTCARLAEHLMAGKSVLSQSDFVTLGINKSLPHCTAVCRFNLGS